MKQDPPVILVVLFFIAAFFGCLKLRSTIKAVEKSKIIDGSGKEREPTDAERIDLAWKLGRSPMYLRLFLIIGLVIASVTVILVLYSNSTK